METLHVLFKSKSYELQLPHGSATTVAQVQELLAHELHVPSDAQRWFQKKKKIDTETSATQLFRDACEDTQLAKLYVMAGASSSQIEHMKQVHQSVDAEQRIRANRRMVSISKRNEMATTRDAVATEYRFHAIEVLPNFSDRDRARDILEKLANDRGILAVMAKHKWTVGTLAEMYPDGKVGVDPVCVLGLNQNKGQKILLRLRTDDLLGFRKYLNIKKVLFHELTHNVHSEHDAKFFQLMSQVEKECAALDWTNAGGAAVGGGGVPIIADDDDDMESSPAARSSGRKLGGGTSTSRLLLSQQERAEESTHEVPRSPVVASPPKRVEELAEHAETRAEPAIADAAPASVPTEVQSDETDPRLSSSSDDVEMVAPSSEVGVPEIERPAASAPDDEMMDAAEDIPGFQPSDREQRILDAIKALRTRHSGEAVAKAVSLLYRILSNIMQNPSEEKFKSIRKANKVFEAQVCRFPEALEFLLAVGFEDQSERFVLVRDDPVLLWVGRSTLETMLSTKA